MAKAIWNGTVIAESEQAIEVDGYTYFPLTSVRKGALKPSSTTSTCPWKGTARYFTVLVNGTENPDAAWTYETPQTIIQEHKGTIHAESTPGTGTAFTITLPTTEGSQ